MIEELMQFLDGTNKIDDFLEKYEDEGSKSFIRLLQIRNLKKINSLIRTILEEEDIKKEVKIFIEETNEIIRNFNKLLSTGYIDKDSEKKVWMYVEVIKMLRSKEKEANA